MAGPDDCDDDEIAGMLPLLISGPAIGLCALVAIIAGLYFIVDAIVGLYN